jgi:hypothetical protein
LVKELRSYPNTILFVGEKHESVKTYDAHFDLLGSIKHNNIKVDKIYLELDDATKARLSPLVLPNMFILLYLIQEIFGIKASSGLSRPYLMTPQELQLLEEDIYEKCTSGATDGVTIAFVGINHIYGIKKLAERHHDNRVIAIDHSFIHPDDIKHYGEYHTTLLTLAKLYSDYNVDPSTKQKIPRLRN